MSIWKDQSPARKDSIPPSPEPTPIRDTAAADFSPTTTAPPRPSATPERQAKESLIASDLTIEGKIEGTGHVRIAGKFKGEVNVQGDLTIEQSARLSGGVKADKVVIAGELEGNIETARQVDLLASGALIGDVKASTLTVASGARFRGQADVGGDGNDSKSSGAA